MRAPPDLPGSLAPASRDIDRERAWTEFLSGYSDVLLRVARSLGGDHDAVMDRYAFILDALRRDEYRRLRAYSDDGRGTFATWLAVVARRLCMDEHRHRYGRAQGNGEVARAERLTRRNLTDLIGGELGLDTIESHARRAPDALLEEEEWRTALSAALAGLETLDRLILRLRFEDGLSVPEIAQLLDLGSPFGLYRRINKVLASVRRTLEAVGIRDAAV